MNEIQIDANLLIAAVEEQRNRALAGEAHATARSVHFQRELEAEKAKVADLEDRIKKLTAVWVSPIATPALSGS